MKINVAFKIIFEEKSKFIIAVLGVSFATFLIIILMGIFFGIRQQVTTYIYSTNAHIWVNEESADSMFAFSVLPYSLKQQIAKKIGSGQVYPLITRSTVIKIRPDNHLYTKRLRDKFGNKESFVKSPALVIGFMPAGLGGPWVMVEGSSDIGPGEVVVDKLLAKNNDLAIGGTIEIQNENFRISGISDQTNMLTEQFVFMTYDDAERIFGYKGSASRFLVRLTNPDDIFLVKTRLREELSKTNVLTTNEIAANNRKFVADNFSPLFFTIAMIGFCVGIIVISLMMYTTTLEKTREYAILKAVGAGKNLIYGIIIRQSLIISGIGFLIGLFLISFSVPLIQSSISILIVVEPAIVGVTAAVVVVMSLVSAYFPIRKIIDIDPLIVFKQ